MVRSARYPPRGAIVFYPEFTSEGHIGISAGDGFVITARSRPNDKGALVQREAFDAKSLPSYAGWAFPRDALR